MNKIAQYLDPELIAFIDVSTRDEALNTLVEIAQEQQKISDKAEFYGAIIDREKIVSTGIGMAVAIPHAKLASYDDFFISIGILSKGVDWNTIDGSPVRIVFMIGGPDDKQTEYLQILSGITSAVKDEDRRKKIINAGTAQEVLDLLSED
ncbi:MAG: PTS sugar transporter subunit IIA [Chlamydiota bacterium]